MTYIVTGVDPEGAAGGCPPFPGSGEGAAPMPKVQTDSFCRSAAQGDKIPAPSPCAFGAGVLPSQDPGKGELPQAPPPLDPHLPIAESARVKDRSIIVESGLSLLGPASVRPHQGRARVSEVQACPAKASYGKPGQPGPLGAIARTASTSVGKRRQPGKARHDD